MDKSTTKPQSIVNKLIVLFFNKHRWGWVCEVKFGSFIGAKRDWINQAFFVLKKSLDLKLICFVSHISISKLCVGSTTDRAVNNFNVLEFILHLENV